MPYADIGINISDYLGKQSMSSGRLDKATKYIARINWDFMYIYKKKNPFLSLEHSVRLLLPIIGVDIMDNVGIVNVTKELPLTLLSENYSLLLGTRWIKELAKNKERLLVKKNNSAHTVASELHSIIEDRSSSLLKKRLQFYNELCTTAMITLD